MRRLAVPLTLLLSLSIARAEEVNAYLGLFASTTANRTAGVPQMTGLPPGVTPEMLERLPAATRAQLQALMSGGAKRDLSVRLWSHGLAPDDATAWVAPPPGLGLGDRLDLSLYRPKPIQGTTTEANEPTTPDAPDFDPTKFVIKRYWGSSATVREGQPQVTTFGDFTPEQQVQWKRRIRSAQKQGQDYYYQPDWTTGYWPSGQQPGTIGQDASLQGTFTLQSSYCGGVALDVPASVEFLDGISLTAPNLDTLPDLAKALAFVWKPLAHVIGLHAQIMAMEGKTTLILWDSSEVPHFGGGGNQYLQMAEVREMVEQTKMMKGETTAVTVPAGIFAEADFVSMTMTGYGNGVARSDTDPRPRLQTKTSLTVMLGGKQMAGRMGPRG